MTEKQFNEIFESTNKQVYRLAYTYTLNHDMTLDICQDVYLALFKRCPKNKDKIYGWLLTVTKNKAIDYLRKNKRQVKLEDEVIDQNSRDLDILYYINKLKKQYQDVIKMHYYMNLSIKEASEILGISVDTFKKRLQRARESLKEKIGDIDEA